MALLTESKRIAAEFEFTDDDVRKNVAEFINQMSA
jgi:hexokinase